jgi:hypothetical protein
MGSSQLEDIDLIPEALETRLKLKKTWTKPASSALVKPW